MDFKNSLKTVRNALNAIMKGELLLKLNIGRYFIHIVWTFVLFGLLIGYAMKVDSAYARVESNSRIIKGLEVEKATMEFRLKSLYRRSTVAEHLVEMGSAVAEPEKPSTELKN